MSRIAVVVGSSEHEDKKLPFLESPAQDAMKLTQVLQNKNIGDYEVKVFLNASSYNVNKAIDNLFSKRKPEDVILFYFSGHGILDDLGNLYFATTDTQTDLLRSTAVSANFVNEILGTSRSKNQVVLLDCCFSGRFSNTNGRGKVVITSSDSTQFSLETKKENEDLATGVFTSTVIEGLETGNADLDRDGQVSIFELYKYTYLKIKENEQRQIPKFSAFNVEGDFIVAKNNHTSSQ